MSRSLFLGFHFSQRSRQRINGRYARIAPVDDVTDAAPADTRAPRHLIPATAQAVEGFDYVLDLAHDRGR